MVRHPRHALFLSIETDEVAAVGNGHGTLAIGGKRLHSHVALHAVVAFAYGEIGFRATARVIVIEVASTHFHPKVFVAVDKHPFRIAIYPRFSQPRRKVVAEAFGAWIVNAVLCLLLHPNIAVESSYRLST